MGHAYRAVGWNRQKRVYDRTLWGAILLLLAIAIGGGALVEPDATAETLMIRAFGTTALVLLHVILAIGPLARLDRRFLPLLYNRRHLGVSMFLLAAAHGGFALFQFHALGDLNPLVSLFVANPRYESFAWFPFQPLGFFALVILFLMAATSHDFWLANLTAPVWKSLHMGVYLAYALIVAHVALGALQTETHPALTLVLGAGLVLLLALHVTAARREAPLDREVPGVRDGGADDVRWVPVGAIDSIPEARAKVVTATGERIAVFRYDGKLSAVSSVCQHQNGPLGEGCVIDGCITCPWHGYQYVPETGASPPPFDERVPTFRLRVENGEVWVDPRPMPPGVRVEPVELEGDPR